MFCMLYEIGGKDRGMPAARCLWHAVFGNSNSDKMQQLQQQLNGSQKLKLSPTQLQLETSN